MCFACRKTNLLDLPTVKCKNNKTMEKKVKKGGRPELKLEKKTKRVVVYFTILDYSNLKAKAILASKSHNDFIREAVLKSEVKAKVSPEQMEEIRKLSNFGNNINQLAKLAHRYGYSDEIHRQTIQSINQIIVKK